MSFQLVHTSHSDLLDSSASGYGTVARTESLPRAMVLKLTAFCAMREPRGGCCTKGPQFSYRIIDYAGSAWHVLSCVQHAGADHTGRACHTAHHLIFAQDEVAALLNHTLRPTPAGITLSLYEAGFWIKQWKDDPRFITGEPAALLKHIPDASLQPAWKQLTGHKSNARAFYTPPYDRECLITVPADTEGTDILKLFHESDWLTHSHGWGVTYTTEADENDSFTETLRMVVGEKSPLIHRAERTGHPVLHIVADMELPVQPAMQPPVSNALPPSPGTPASPGNIVGVTRVLSRSNSHYHYTEDPDWMLYDVPIPRSKPYMLPLGVAGIITLLTGVSVGIWLGLSEPVQNIDEIIRKEFPRRGVSTQDTAFIKFARVLKSPYDHTEVTTRLNELAGNTSTEAEDTLIAECAAIIQHSSASGINHASALKRLCECARLLGLHELDVANLYIRVATHDVDPDEWSRMLNTNSRENWKQLKEQEPRLANLFQAEDLKDYEPGTSVCQDLPTVLAPATEDQSAGNQKPAVIPQQVKGLHPIVCGDTLPESLAQLLDNLPATITSGTYSVCYFKKGEPLQAAEKLELSTEDFHLYITPTKNEGEYQLVPEHKDGRRHDIPAVTFKISKGKLQRLKCRGGEAVVAFPVPANETTLTNIVLASRIAIPIPTGNSFSFPPVDNQEFLVEPNMLRLSEKGNHHELKLKKRDKDFPWKLSKKHIEHIRFSIQLPVLIEGKPNSIIETHDDSAAFIWQRAVVTGEDKQTTTLRCEVEHRPDLPGRMNQTFHRVANTPCCRDLDIRRQDLTLAQLYYISERMENDKLRSQQRNKLFRAYLEMLQHKKFNAELQQILKAYPGLLLTHEEANSSKSVASHAQKELEDFFNHRTSSQYFKNAICDVLSASLREAYNQEIKDFAKDKQKQQFLILRKLSQGAQGELLWHFHLRSGK